MTKLSGLDETREAAGDNSIAELERRIREALAKGSVSQTDARTAVRNAGKERAVASDLIDRLGLNDSVSPESPTTRPSNRVAQETLLRTTSTATAKPLASARDPARRDPNSASAQKNAAGNAAGTDALWMDPDPEAVSSGGRGMVGQLLGGRYLLERELGSGGMGVVYLASDQEVDGEKFAAKVLKPEIRGYPEALPLLREEVRTTRALRHPNIVGVYSLNSDRRNIFMLMEYLEGKTLDALLNEEFGRGMPFSRAWPLISDICDALAYAHDHNVVHSDIKPSNVFITMAGRAKLLDFGIARVARTRNGRFDPSTVGALTLAYASCEMLEGYKPDQSDDVYALACVIYEMLTGTHPFDLRSSLEAREKLDRVTPIASLTENQNNALAQALAFSRNQRTSTVEALLEGLDRTISPQLASGRVANATLLPDPRAAASAQTPAPARHESVRPRLDRHYLIVGVLLASLIAIGIVALYFYRAQQTASHSPVVTPIANGNTPAVTAMAPEPAPPADLPPVATAEPQQTSGFDVSPTPDDHKAAPQAPPHPIARTSVTPLAVSSAPAAPDTRAQQAEPAMRAAAEDADQPPPAAAHVPAVLPLPESAEALSSCPYPELALRQGQTGSVGLLVHVSADGSARSVLVKESSGSDELDQASVHCVQENGRFPPKRGGSKAQAYWAHMRYNWSFGG